MIKTVDPAEHNYSECDGFYIKVFREIPEDEYKRLSELSHGQLNDEIEAILPDEILFGYGFYGGGLFKKFERYYYFYKRGASCD